MSRPSFVTRTDDSPAGLTTAEARRRLQDSGPNNTPEEALRTLRLIAGKFIAPVPCLLEAAIALQLVLGEYIEASIIGALLVFNAALGFLHESHAQATIAALKSRLALNASVRRDGDWKTVPAAELVAGDIIKLSLGAVVAADGVFSKAQCFSISRCSPASRCPLRRTPAVRPMPARWSAAARPSPR